MPDGRPLGTATAVAAVPFDRIREPVLAIRPGVLGPEIETLLGLPDEGSAPSLDVDPDRLMVTIRGQLWYRGEFTYR